MSIYLFCCLPRLRSPRTSDFIILLMLVSPDRYTCPYHLSLASRILSVMHATPIVFRMFSFLCISFREIPSIHLSILISVLSRSFSSFLLSVHASAPYIITGLIIVLYIFPLRATVILGSHITPVRSLHFCQAVLILFLTSCSQPPVLCIIDPSLFPSLSTITNASSVLEHTIVSVLLVLSPLLSSSFCHLVNLVWAPVVVLSATMRSSAYNISQGTSLLMFSDTASITIVNSSGLKHDPLCNPTLISNSAVLPALHLTDVRAPSYIDFISRTIFSVIPFFLRLQYITSLGTLSKAFSRSTNVQYLFSFPSRTFSCVCLSIKIASVVPLPFMNLN